MELLLGIVLLATGAGMLVAEAHLPTAGLLGAVGVASLGAGSVLSVVGAGGSVVVAILVALTVAVVSGAAVAVATREAMRASRRRPRGGAEGLVGHVGVLKRAPDALGDPGQVFVDGALWRASPALDDPEEEPLREGDRVVVERVHGLTLSVRRADPLELPS